MNKNAFIGIVLVLFLPLAGYFLLKGLSKNALSMPQPIFYDTVLTVVKDGKQKTDTQWHTVPPFTVTDQFGQRLNSKDLYTIDDKTGDTVRKIMVASFFFTHCGTICPRMTKNIQQLQRSLGASNRVGDNDADYVYFLSFTVDPDRDSVARLKEWANRFQIDPENWRLVTGSKEQIYKLAIKDMGVWAQDPKGIDTAFVHTDILVLIDSRGRVRMSRDAMGNPRPYHALDSADLNRLSQDIATLHLEKDPGKKSFLTGKLELLAIVFLVTIMILGAFFMILKRSNKKAYANSSLDQKRP